MIDLILQNLVNGLLLGGIYALMAVGVSLAWGIQRVSNSSQAAFSILGAYVTYWLFTMFGVDPFLSIIPCMALYFPVGILIYKHLLYKIKGKNMVLMIFLATWAIAMFMENSMILAWTGINRGITTTYSGLSFSLGEINVPVVRAACFAISITIILALTFFLNRTKTGKAMRAVAQDRDAATLMGVNVNRIFYITYGIAVATAGAAGPLVALVYIFAPPTQAEWTMLLYSITVVGGMGSIFGTLVAAIMIAVLQMVITIFVPYIYGFLVTYLLLLITLIIRPDKGLFGK